MTRQTKDRNQKNRCLNVKLGKDLSINNNNSNNSLIARCINYINGNWLAEEHCLYDVTAFCFFQMIDYL